MTLIQLLGLYFLIIGQKYGVTGKLEKNITDIILYGILTIGGALLMFGGW